MSYYQGQPHQFLFRLVDPTMGSPVISIPASSLTVSYMRPLDTGFVQRAVASADLTEVGSGYYRLNFTATDFSQLGLMIVKIICSSAVPVFQGIDVDPAPVALLASPQTCLLSGNIADVGGMVYRPTAVRIHPLTVPAQVAGTTLLSAHEVTTFTDAQGNFSIALLRGSRVRVEIDDCGVNFVLTVPVQASATLLSVLPV